MVIIGCIRVYIGNLSVFCPRQPSFLGGSLNHDVGVECVLVPCGVHDDSPLVKVVAAEEFLHGAACEELGRLLHHVLILPLVVIHVLLIPVELVLRDLKGRRHSFLVEGLPVEACKPCVLLNLLVTLEAKSSVRSTLDGLK